MADKSRKISDLKTAVDSLERMSDEALANVKNNRNKDHDSDEINLCYAIVESFEDKRDKLLKTIDIKTRIELMKTSYKAGEIVTSTLDDMGLAFPVKFEDVQRVCDEINANDQLSEQDKLMARYVLKTRLINFFIQDYEELDRNMKEFRKKLRKWRG